MKPNGKVYVSVGFVLTLIAGGIGYGELKNKVATLGEDYKDVKETPTEIALIRQDVAHLRGDFKEFKTEQRTLRVDMTSGFKELLKAVKDATP